MTAIDTTLRINMTGCSSDRDVEAARHQAAMEMMQYADRNGFALINLEEHHCADVGWMTSPLVMAGVAVARTERIRIRVSALLITLYDPIRLAEELALLDVLSRGRVFYIFGQGYRPIEFHALDKNWERRGADSDFMLETLLQAWRGEPFQYRGQTVRVLPKPYSQPHPPLYYGGMSRAAARRAAKFKLPFFPPADMPELEAFYREEAARRGFQGEVATPGADATLLFIDENPERAWEELGRYFLAEAREYSSWRREGVERPYEADEITLDLLRQQRRYEIVTPAECRRRIAAAGERYRPILHPLCGGIPVERAWRCMELYVEQVLRRPR